MPTNRLLTTGFCVLMAAALGHAQISADGDASTNPIVSSHNISGAAVDGIAVSGQSIPQPFYGIGVHGEGGYIGVRGWSTVSGSGSRFGGYFVAYGGTSNNYGVYASGSGTGAYAGYFQGNVYISGTLSNPSDSRLKTNIQPLQGNLQKLASLRPSSYNFDAIQTRVKGLPERRQLGLLADDVAAVLPELVTDVPIPEDPGEAKNPAPGASATFKSVNYTGMIPVLVGAIKEQQAEIAALKDALAKLSK
ncbi:MAG: tail fiber domain-containing protein [Fibrobacteres bacterium]|jgi:hypothetical protein|nr:tail fiber domain-containing protein [Fibrobacterota bacterium]